MINWLRRFYVCSLAKSQPDQSYPGHKLLGSERTAYYFPKSFRVISKRQINVSPSRQAVQFGFLSFLSRFPRRRHALFQTTRRTLDE
jgi:hypothetical protein